MTISPYFMTNTIKQDFGYHIHIHLRMLAYLCSKRVWQDISLQGCLLKGELTPIEISCFKRVAEGVDPGLL